MTWFHYIRREERQLHFGKSDKAETDSLRCWPKDGALEEKSV
jgi:hypothetical protein